MPDSILLETLSRDQEKQPLTIEGIHQPDDLARASGIWIGAAGSAMMSESQFMLHAFDGWIWLALESGSAVMREQDETGFSLHSGDCCMLPPGTSDVALEIKQETRILWIAIDGPLSGAFMQKLGAFSHRIMRQGALPSQIKLAKHIVQSAVRVSTSADVSSAQLQQLLWAMLASHAGQPVAMDAVLSHEIARVIDAMRRNRFKDSFSLAEMASISRMPVETFRKRFVAEVGMPPQSYQLFCKMERAKVLLKEGLSVRQAGIQVGMNDPYHFSKTFKNFVGMSPSAYSKVVDK